MKSSANNEIRDYFKILKDDPSSRVFAPLAEALVRRGRLDEAEEICKMGLEANPDFSDGHLAYARVLYYLFRYQEAIKQVKLTLASAPESVEAYLIAAEVFLARSQHKSASDACLKAIDSDPENIEARQILRRINAQAKEHKAGKVPAKPRREPTAKFRSTAGTAPSRRVQESNGKASQADPFRQLLQETGKLGAGRLDGVEQPFSAMSPGSYPADDRDFGEADTGDLDSIPATEKDLDQHDKLQQARKDDQVMGMKKFRRDGTPIPKLPEHPQGPGDLLEQVPKEQAPLETTDPDIESPHYLPPGSPASHPPPPEVVTDSEIPGVDEVQTLIDAYSLRSQNETYDSAPDKMPRSGRLLVILFVLGSVGAIVGLLVLGFSRDRQVPEADDAKPAAVAPVVTTDEPIPLPEPEPELTPEAAPEVEAPAPEPEPEPEPVKKAVVKPKPKKTSRRRRRRRRKKKRKRKKRKKKKRTSRR